jgi:hypothetical protein
MCVVRVDLSGQEEFTLVHLSDFHIARGISDPKDVYDPRYEPGKDAFPQLKRRQKSSLAKDLRACFPSEVDTGPKPDMFLITGDLVHSCDDEKSFDRSFRESGKQTGC